MVSPYPVRFDVDFPARPLGRLATAFRIILALPIVVVLTMLTSMMAQNDHNRGTIALAAGVLFLPLVVMLLFRQKYPRWWFDWNLNLLRFSNRVTAYLALLDDRYPSTDEEQSVHLEFAYPDAHQLNRWLPLVKWLLAIPHYVALLFLGIASIAAIVIAWFAILFTGRYPQGLFNFVVGVLRWSNRVTAYAFALVTDQYPPFRLG
jgi:cobalamin synthase